MGYFPNGTSGGVYQELYCMRCVHDRNQDCPVWLAHLLYNYDAVDENKHKELAHVLNLLIPRDDENLRNKQCAMFIEDVDRPDPNQMDMFKAETA